MALPTTKHADFGPSHQRALFRKVNLMYQSGAYPIGSIPWKKFADLSKEGIAVWFVPGNDVGSMIMAYANESAAIESGASPENWVGKPLRISFPGSVDSEWALAVLHAAQTGMPCSVRTKWGDGGIRKVWWRIDVVPLGDRWVGVRYNNLSRGSSQLDAIREMIHGSG